MVKRLRKSDYVVDAVTVAKRLLGKRLCRRLNDGTVLKARIVETEAYCGEGDTACHAHCGRTERNAPMYEAGGIAYATKRDQNRKWRFVMHGVVQLTAMYPK